MSTSRIVTKTPARASFVHLVAPKASAEGQDPKYSLLAMFPKSDTRTKAEMDACIEAARLAAQSKGIKNWKTLKSPIHDGDGEKPNGGAYGPECAGMGVVNCSSKTKPGIVDKHLQPIIDPSEIYSGMWVKLDLNFYGYSVSGNSGIACGLNNVQKVRDDDPLGGGRERAENVFQAADDDEDDLGL